MHYKDNDKSIIPGTGASIPPYSWPGSGAIPASYSAGGWTISSHEDGQKDSYQIDEHWDFNDGFQQQTFLGASIRNFNATGGFGDSSSSLNIQLVCDEFNKSDELGLGLGDDVYHNGKFDNFTPPPVGTPVFFKFGRHKADVEDAWRNTFDKVYGYKTLDKVPKPKEIQVPSPSGISEPMTEIPQGRSRNREREYIYYDMPASKGPLSDPDQNKRERIWQDRSKQYEKKGAIRKNLGQEYNGRGRNHFNFGGILQSYTQNRGPGGNPTYSVAVTDPREILANVDLILNNYGGTTYNNKNLINVYGFLENDISEDLENTFKLHYGCPRIWPNGVMEDNPYLLHKLVDPTSGAVTFLGDDLWKETGYTYNFSNIMLPEVFPATGKGMSRRSEKGIPLYRVMDALTALLEYNGRLPQEIREKGFGGAVDFRGFKYVVDFSGIPIKKIEKIAPYYFLDFDQMSMLDLAQELCDIISHDLFVSLLPVINHPASEWLHDWNDYVMNNIGDIFPYLFGNDPNHKVESGDIIAGIIRVDAIDRSVQPEYGTIKKYIDDLETRGVKVENSDIGFELSNVPTDKFVVGAQETKMHFFTGNKDRDHLEVRKYKNGIPNRADFMIGDQWMLHRSLEQQIIPFYGFLGKDAVSIPRGFGSYQQILLDTTGLNANGVGNYYVATELELRAASLGYKHWKEFLLQYNDLYMESMEENDVVEKALLLQVVKTCRTRQGSGYWDTWDVCNIPDPGAISNNYGVSVPRCVWRSDRNYVGQDGLPASPCSPPYGYPLYFKRAEKIGIPEAGVAKIAAAKTSVITNLAKLRSKDGQDQFSSWVNSIWQRKADAPLNKTERQWLSFLEGELGAKIKDNPKAAGGMASALVIGLLEDVLESHCMALANVQRVGEKSIENSMKVFNFLKGVADKHLGKTFLVKIPKRTNLAHSPYINLENYGNQVVNARVSAIDTGPFGFKPQPISSQMGFLHSMMFQVSLYNKRLMERYFNESYLSLGHPDDRSYTYGALKNNYNPMADQYEHNYVPNNQGGFYESTQYAHLLTPSDVAQIADQMLPVGTQQMLIPKDVTNFVSDDGRIQCYVAFYNSQFLNFSSVQKDSMTQEKITPFGNIPDLVEQMDNIKKDKFTSLNPTARLKHAYNNPSVAYVKCDVDEKLYMVPQSTVVFDKVFGREVLDIGGQRVTSKVWNPKRCKFEDSIGYYEPHFVPNPANGGFDGTMVLQEDFVRTYNPILNGEIIRTETRTDINLGVCKPVNPTPMLPDPEFRGQDPENVYALITVPGRVSPTIDSRCQDGPYQMIRPTLIKHFLTMDTVKGVIGFNKPTMRGKPSQILRDICSAVTIDQIGNAFEAYKQTMEKIGIASAEARLHMAAPSPVYPDLVAFPLTSKDRCYGPWVSSQLGTQATRYAELGGKCEFVKEENLAPWNYAGYQLMNEAGRLQAEFSNSLLLFSERGGFIIPAAPAGNSLGQQLMGVGPLVTNITVDVGDGGIKTTYKMDLYTA